MKTLTSLAAASLIVISSVQLAAAAPRQHQTKADRATIQQQSRTSDAYAYWPSEQPTWRAPGPTNYSGGFSAPAGR
jgi:opacity protein-like surface antigen